MAKGRNEAGEAPVEPASSASERETLDALVASFSHLDGDQLRLQWRNHLGGVATAHLPGWLIMRVLAYRIQASAFGDLDRAILRRLRDPQGEAFELGVVRLFANRRPTTPEGVGLKSGALLFREWHGRLERVMIIDDGYAWNGCVYRSLSQVAKAITGTNWNGHRFFGLKTIRKGASNRRRSATTRPNPLLDVGVSPRRHPKHPIVRPSSQRRAPIRHLRTNRLGDLAARADPRPVRSTRVRPRGPTQPVDATS